MERTRITKGRARLVNTRRTERTRVLWMVMRVIVVVVVVMGDESDDNW